MYCRALREAPDSAGITARLEELGKTQNKLPAMIEAARAICLQGQRGSAARQAALGEGRAACAIVELGDVDGAVAAYMQALEPRRERHGRARARSRRCIAAASAIRDLLLGVLRRKAGNVIDPREQEAAAGADRRDPRRDARRAGRRDPDLSRGARDGSGEHDGAVGARRPVRTPADVERAGREHRPPAVDGGGRSRAHPADAAARERARDAHGRGRRRRSDLPRGARSRSELRAPALAALERLVHSRATKCASPEILEPLYRDAGRSRS